MPKVYIQKENAVTFATDTKLNHILQYNLRAEHHEYRIIVGFFDDVAISLNLAVLEVDHFFF